MTPMSDINTMSAVKRSLKTLLHDISEADQNAQHKRDIDNFMDDLDWILTVVILVLIMILLFWQGKLALCDFKNRIENWCRGSTQLPEENGVRFQDGIIDSVV